MSLPPREEQTMINIKIDMNITAAVGIAFWFLGKNPKAIYHLIQYFFPL